MLSQANLRLYKTMSVPSPQKSPLCVAIWQEHALLLLDVIVLTGKFFFSPYFSLRKDIPSGPLASMYVQWTRTTSWPIRNPGECLWRIVGHWWMELDVVFGSLTLTTHLTLFVSFIRLRTGGCHCVK
jgi:hypothetical protein